MTDPPAEAPPPPVWVPIVGEIGEGDVVTFYARPTELVMLPQGVTLDARVVVLRGRALGA